MKSMGYYDGTTFDAGGLSGGVTTDAPALVEPLDEAVLDDTTPEFSWHSVLGAATYDIEIGETLTGTPTATGIATTSYTPDALSDLTAYSWWVRAVNAGGGKGTWSAIRTFTVGVFSDSFNRADGASANGWSGGAIVSNKLVVTPSLGSELLTDAGLESWASATDLTSWAEVAVGSSSVNREASVLHGGTYAARLDIDGSGSTAQISQAVTAAVGVWLRDSVWLRGSGTNSAVLAASNGIPSGDLTVALTTSYVNTVCTRRVTGAFPSLIIKRAAGLSASSSIYIDDVSRTAIPTATMLSVHDCLYANAAFQVDITRVVGTQTGIVQYKDANNFVLVYLNGFGQLVIDTCIAGVYTQVASVNATYAAGATLKVNRNASQQYTVTYNGTALISNQTILESAFDTATNWGVFTSYEGNTFDNVVFTANPT